MEKINTLNSICQNKQSFHYRCFRIDAPMNPAINGLIGKAIKWTIGITADTKIIMKEIVTDNNILLLEY